MHSAEDLLRTLRNDEFSVERGYFRNFTPPIFDKNGSPLWSPTGPPIPLQTSTFPSIFRSCLHIVTFFQFSSENKFKSGDKKLNDVIFRRQRFQAAKSGTDGAPFSQYFCRWIRLPVGPYVDLLHDERGQPNSNLCARLFPNITDACLRLKDLEDYIMSPNYLSLQNEDVVMLIQLVFMLKGLNGQDVKTCIPTAVYVTSPISRSEKTGLFMLYFKIIVID
uniref:Uncharacterized protein n=1 Tax=Lactuca sativa TaxID=4236 RepID=A0A9R1VTL7_LACSA|nr:hypothetical protein LSAT_V11C400224230 [Lactuca sativa]